jgi:hypothetical protein
MSNGSDDSEEQPDSTLDQLKELIEELKDDKKSCSKWQNFSTPLILKQKPVC